MEEEEEMEEEEVEEGHQGGVNIRQELLGWVRAGGSFAP